MWGGSVPQVHNDLGSFMTLSARALSILPAELQAFRACRQSGRSDFEGEMADVVRQCGVTLNWLNIVIWGPVID